MVSVSFIFKPSNCLLRLKICIFLDFSSPWNYAFNLSHVSLAYLHTMILVKMSSLTALWRQERALNRFAFSSLKNFICAIVGLFLKGVGCLSLSTISHKSKLWDRFPFLQPTHHNSALWTLMFLLENLQNPFEKKLT